MLIEEVATNTLLMLPCYIYIFISILVSGISKFYRKFAGQVGFDFVNFWMGHLSTLGVDLRYSTQDPEFHRKQYAEKAMPFLRLEAATPTETEKTIEKLKEQISNKDQKLQELEQKITKFEPLFDLLSNTNNLERLLKDLEQGLYAKVESERSLTMQIPKRVIEKLAERGKAKGEDRIEFTLDQLKKMSTEDSEKDKEDREEETDWLSQRARLLRGASQTMAGACSLFSCLLACSSGDSVTGTGFSFPERTPIFSRCVIVLIAML